MGKEIKIIIADDNRNICQMLQNHLQVQADLSVVGVANNGLEAMELIQSQEPDLIILDLVMPSLDGLGVLERINANTSIKRPKVIMLTAFGQESLTHQAMMLGVDYFILKPFDLDILSKRIRSLTPVSYTHLRAHETRHDLVCRLLLEKKKKQKQNKSKYSQEPIKTNYYTNLN